MCAIHTLGNALPDGLFVGIAGTAPQRDFIQRGSPRRDGLRFGDDSGLRERLGDRNMTLNTLRMPRTGIMLLVDGIEEQGRHRFAVVGSSLQWF